MITYESISKGDLQAKPLGPVKFADYNLNAVQARVV